MATVPGAGRRDFDQTIDEFREFYD